MSHFLSVIFDRISATPDARVTKVILKSTEVNYIHGVSENSSLQHWAPCFTKPQRAGPAASHKFLDPLSTRLDI